MEKIITLDENVLQALDFFAKNPPPKLDLSQFSLPFVIGSGNAFNTGRILFSDKAAIFADESNFKHLIESYHPIIKKGLIKDALVISASGEKDSVWEVELAKKHGLKTTLMTCNANSPAAQVADKVLAYRKIAEPYTYNFSTYLGMILSTTGENVLEIKKFITQLEFPNEFESYEDYSFIFPDRFSAIRAMIDKKRSELFGPLVSVRAYPQGHARHAEFVIPRKEELVITINGENKYFGHPDSRWSIQMPENLSFGAMMSLTYYITGLIQKSKPPYFMENIENYCNDYGPRAYGKDTPFDVIVPGN